ncbi:MAG: hypothetical protein IT341_10770 [Chloroflexi bacterium]|nr:hypothetical protein [Chloroflexota bacterium]
MPAKKPAFEPELPPALRYLGDASGQPHLSGIPSRDLSADDVSRLAHRHGLSVRAFVALACRGPFTKAALPAADESPSADGKE